MTIKPVRIQLQRTKGFDLQLFSQSINGLVAERVDRATMWGNPFRVSGSNGRIRTPGGAWAPTVAVADLDESLRRFEEGLLQGKKRMGMIHVLRGRNLACWCALGAKCHADILLRLANQEERSVA